MNYQLHKCDQLTQALLDDGIYLEDITEKLAFIKSQLHHIKNCIHTWDYLEHNDATFYELSDALIAIKNVEYFLKTGQSSESSPKPTMNLRRITWKTKLEKFFSNSALAFLASSALLGSASLGFWGLSQARPDISQFEVATNTTKGLAIASFGGVLICAIGGGIAGTLSDMENKEID